jgi:hypothetical protein
MARERLQKLMARAGLGSRRACEEIIREGRVMVNGRIATLGDGADLAVDKVHVDGVPLRLTEIPTTVALYKPMQTLSTDQPHRGDRRATARSLIPLETRLFAIGRLDADSEGLMLFTNDGDLAHRLSGRPIGGWDDSTGRRDGGGGRKGGDLAARHHARGAQAADSAGGCLPAASRAATDTGAHRPGGVGAAQTR